VLRANSSGEKSDQRRREISWRDSWKDKMCSRFVYASRSSVEQSLIFGLEIALTKRRKRRDPSLESLKKFLESGQLLISRFLEFSLVSSLSKSCFLFSTGSTFRDRSFVRAIVSSRSVLRIVRRDSPNLRRSRGLAASTLAALFSESATRWFL